MAQTPAFSDGRVWFKESLSALRRQPVALPGIVIFSTLVSGLLSGFPFIGAILASCWMPFGAVLTGYAARDTLEGRVPTYQMLPQIFRDAPSRWPLLGIGLLSSLWFEVEMVIFDYLGADAIAAWKITEKGIDFESVMANLPVTAFVTTVILYVPLLMMTVFAPLLVADKRQALGKSLFYSFFGVLRNLPPVVVFVVLLFGLTAGSGLILEALFAAIGLPNALPYVAPLLIAVLTTVAQAGIWVMYRDLFEQVRRGSV